MKATRKQDNPLRPTAVVRFLAKVAKVPSGCWLWTAALTGDGYGWFRRPHGAPIRAHAWAYEYFVGPVPAGLELDHLCRVRECVNPDHLESVTHQENLLRGDTWNARNAAKTHCKHGHEFTPENTYIRPDGNRDCRACKRILKANSKNRKATA